jgi:hypothetical protein
VGQVDRVREGQSERIEVLAGRRYQQAAVFRLGGGWSGSGFGSATSQSEQGEAAASGERYDSATTNGLPPSLALISTAAAAASALVG